MLFFLQEPYVFLSKTDDDKSLSVLKEVAECPDFWVKVHAIEYLADLGYIKEAQRLVQEELSSFSTIPEKRIGFWRINYKVAATEKERNIWLQNIVVAYLNIHGTDRIHAAETLSKLGYSFRNLNPAVVSDDLANAQGMLYSFVLWGNSIPLPEETTINFEGLLEQLDHEDEQKRKLAAYALSFFNSIPLNDWEKLAGNALNEPFGTEASSYLLGAAYSLYDRQTNADGQKLRKIRKRLLQLETSESRSDRIELCRALAEYSEEKDWMILNRLREVQHPLSTFSDEPPVENSKEHPWNLDVKAAAAYALIKGERDWKGKSCTK